jgi:hypothetical protein
VQVQFNLQGLYLGGQKEGTKYDAVAALVRLFLGLLFQNATGKKTRIAPRHSSCVITWNVGLRDKDVYLCCVWGIQVN